MNIGDNFQGTLWYELLGWNVTKYFLNMLEADATTLGNHEFDRGVPEVVEYLKNLDSDVVVANLDHSEEPDLEGLYKKSKVVVRDGRKIGLVGALVVATLDISEPGKLKILDEIEYVKKEAERLRDEEGVDIVVVLSHCGLVIDREMAQKGGSAIDVIVGGHSHSLLHNGTEVPGSSTAVVDTYPIVYEQEGGHKVLIVQASAYTKFVGDLTVYFDEAGEAVSWEGNTIFMVNTIVPDPQIIEELKPWKEKVDAVGQRVIGSVKSILYQADCSRLECNIGNFVTDSFVNYFMNHPEYKPEDGAWSYVTIGITNAGGIRTSLPAGEVNFDDLFTVLPFSNTIDTFELQGKDLLDALQISADWYRYYNFLQFSGLKVVYNVTVPEEAKVISVDVLCRVCEIPRYEKLDPEEWYRIAMPGFIAAGGNGFTPFTKRRNALKGDKSDVEVVEEFMTRLSPVFYKKEGRISFV